MYYTVRNLISSFINNGLPSHWAYQQQNTQELWETYFGLGQSRRAERTLDYESYHINWDLILAPSSTLTLGKSLSM